MIRAYYVASRWCTLLLYAVIGSLLASYGFAVLEQITQSKLRVLVHDNEAAIVFFNFVLATIALVLIHNFAWTRLKHARWISYPLLPIAVVGALLMAHLWPTFSTAGKPLPTLDRTASFLVAGVYVVLWIIQTSAVWVIRGIKARLTKGVEPVDSMSPYKSLEQLTESELVDWIDYERPIRYPCEDLFGFWQFTIPVLAKLGKPNSTIAIRGAFGSGKTSFVRLLELRASTESMRAWFIRVSCWGFEDSIAAQQALLSAIINRVSEEVDSLSIRNLPKEYVSIITKKFQWADFFSTPDESPLEQLRRVTPILGAIRARVIVIVEDVDRVGQKFDVSTVFSLLAQFRSVEGLSFMLPISPFQAVDFAKFCEFSEILPTPSTTAILSICQRVRDSLVKDYPDDILVDKLEDLIGVERIHPIARVFAPAAVSWPEAVAEVLAVPRFLKGVLRRLRSGWSVLHGEVSIDALLMTCTLREAAPSAFSFLQSELEHILLIADSARWSDHSDAQHRETLQNRLKSRWQEVVSRGEFDPDPVEILVMNLVPGISFLSDLQTFPTTLKQGPSGHRAAVYAKRLFTEHLEMDV